VSRRTAGRRRAPGRHAIAALLIAALAAGLLSAGASAAVRPRASLIAIENDVMCVVCHESLAVAQSPEAYSERDYIRGLILQGETQSQIEKNLVAQYGPAVLALPPAHGFNLLVYIVPPALVIAGLATLALTIPRWRRRAARAAAAEPPAARSPLDPADALRLQEDIARRA
jgi:cytochrome c-type biogenesis protein CcmH